MPDAQCVLAQHGDAYVATFDEPQWAPTPGQYLVLYDDDSCLGGGVIAASRVHEEATRTAATEP